MYRQSAPEHLAPSYLPIPLLHRLQCTLRRSLGVAIYHPESEPNAMLKYDVNLIETPRSPNPPPNLSSLWNVPLDFATDRTSVYNTGGDYEVVAMCFITLLYDLGLRCSWRPSWALHSRVKPGGWIQLTGMQVAGGEDDGAAGRLSLSC